MDARIQIMDEGEMGRALSRMAHQIIERNPDISDMAVIGIHRRGVPISKRLVERIAQYTGVWPDWGSVDIAFYRDDLSMLGEIPIVGDANMLFPLGGRTVVLVDDVLFTGRTVYAALNAIMGIGRPKCIQLAVLVDRGHRELPIKADYVGRSVPTNHREVIKVQMSEIDGSDEVQLVKPAE